MAEQPNERISQLTDKLYHETLEDHVCMLEKAVRWSENPYVISGYCACSDELFNQVFDYIKGVVAPNTQEFEVELEPNQRNLRPYLQENIQKINLIAGEVVLIKARGFERLNGLDHRHQIDYRLAHDYDQDICESIDKRFPGLEKKVLLVTNIGLSMGRGIYEDAIRSACGSGFKEFLYVME